MPLKGTYVFSTTLQLLTVKASTILSETTSEPHYCTSSAKSLIIFNDLHNLLSVPIMKSIPATMLTALTARARHILLM